MIRVSQCWSFFAALAVALCIISPAGGGDDPRDAGQHRLRAATEDYARGDLDNAWFGFWSLARAGSPAAQFNLGQLYRQGQGIPADLAQARYWYAASAAQGYAYAQYNLGIMYEFGHGTGPDLTEATRWYRRAAAQDLPEAQRALRRLEARQAGQAPVAQAGSPSRPSPE
jgi:TPR repeat protein